MKIYRIISRYKINKYENSEEVLYEFKNYKQAKKRFDEIITDDLEDELVLAEFSSDDEFTSSIELETKQFPAGDDQWEMN